jgi:hypothetical protein
MLLITVLHGCAMRPGSVCRGIDWYESGYQEAVAGRAEGSHSCANEVGEAALESYSEGRQAGLQVYCQPANGFRLGNNADEYQGVCTGAAEADFLRAYEEGKQIHDVEVQIERLGAILEVNESERDRLGEQLRLRQTQLDSHQGHIEGRAVLRAELRELRETRTMVETEIRAIRAALEGHQAQLVRLQQSSRQR